MVDDGTVTWQTKEYSRKRTFLQPIAIGSACAVFIGLILFMGIMDLRRSERSLVGFLENQGLSLVNIVQGLTQDNLNMQVQVQQAKGGATYSPLQTLVGAALATEFEARWKSKRFTNKEFSLFASEKGLWLVAFMDNEGKILFRNRPLSPDLLPADALNTSSPQLMIDLLIRAAREHKKSIFALTRKDGSGTIIIGLDREGSNYWALKVSVANALEKLGAGHKQGLFYMVISDIRGMQLGSTGNNPDEATLKMDTKYSAATAKRKIVSRKMLDADTMVLDMKAPFVINGKTVGMVNLGLDAQRTDAILKENRQNLIIIVIFVVLITLISMWLLFHNQNKHLAGIVEMERRLEKAERLSALGQLAAGVAHEIRNPLNAISMASQRLKREFTPLDDAQNRDFQTLSDVIRDEIRRLNGIVEEFLSFSKSRRLDLHQYSALEVLQKIINLIGEEAQSRGVNLDTTWDESPFIIPMDMDKLQQALLNIVKNAMESINGSGTITFSIHKTEKHFIRITISDTGCGMTGEQMDLIFNPDYTTKEKGLGLGLALAHEIILGHGGDIRVTSIMGSGTTFYIFLPTEHTNSR